MKNSKATKPPTVLTQMRNMTEFWPVNISGEDFFSGKRANTCLKSSGQFRFSTSFGLGHNERNMILRKPENNRK